MTDTDAIRNLLADYCFLIDARELAALGALFTQDGSWSSRNGAATGPSAIQALLDGIVPPAQSGTRRKHLTTNIRIHQNGDAADVTSNFLVMRESGADLLPAVAGTYTDVVIREAGTWKFGSRTLSHDMLGQGAALRAPAAMPQARMAMPALDAMTPEQRAAHDEAASGIRGHAPAPMAAWIRNPELARRAQLMGGLLRYQTSLAPRLSELAILVVARHWTSHYEWKVHRAMAAKAGLAEAAIAAIAARQVPHPADEAERVVFAVTDSLLRTQSVPDALYAEAVVALGEAGLVELVCVAGYYGMVSMTLNTFGIGLPDAFQTELEPGP